MSRKQKVEAIFKKMSPLTQLAFKHSNKDLILALSLVCNDSFLKQHDANQKQAKIARVELVDLLENPFTYLGLKFEVNNGCF